MRKARDRTLRFRVFVSLLMIVIVQCSLIGGVIAVNGTISKLNQSAEETFLNSVENNGEALENMLIEIGRIQDFKENIERIVAETAKAEKIEISELSQSEQMRKILLQNSCEEIVSCIRSHDVTECFMILEGDEGTDTKDALILRDLDTTTESSSNYDIFAQAGEGKFLTAQGFTLDSYWSEKLVLGENRDFYVKPLEAGNTYTEMSAIDVGYYCPSFRLHKNDIQMLSYSIPLLDENHHAYGVIGVGISLQHLEKKLGLRSIAFEPQSAFYLGMTQDGKNFQNIFVSKGKYNSFFKVGGMSYILDDGELTEVYPEGIDIDAELARYNCHLYNNNTPFQEEQWVLGGVVSRKVLHGASSSLKHSLIWAMVISAMICIAGAILITHNMMRPLNLLFKGIGDLSKKRILPRTRIKEIDNLAQEIELRTREVYEAGGKFADALDIAEVQLGIVEFKLETKKVFCTRKVLDMLELADTGWKENYISIVEMEKIAEDLKKKLQPDEEEQDVYYFDGNWGKRHWISIRKVNYERSKLYVLMDETASIQEKQKIRHDRDYDILTNLFNRRAFLRVVEKEIASGNCDKAVFSIWDLDNLKYMNDTYGHDMGDKYIQLMAKVLRRYQSKECVAARMAGDEFTVFCCGKNVEELILKTREIHQDFSQEKIFLPDGKIASVSVSAGMAVYDQDADNYQELVKYADFAMYEVKNSNKGEIRLFNRDSYIQNYIMVQGVGELNRILEEGDISYVFQPIVDVNTMHIHAYEALMRPNSDIIKSPDELIRLAEKESRLMQVESCTWMLSAEQFFNKQKPKPGIRLFVNSIPNQRMTTAESEELLEKYGRYLKNVTMEITEVARSNEDIEQEKSKWCEKHLISLALDDYGSGYSNSDILISKRFDYVKLDMSLIRDIHMREDTQHLVKSMIEYCHNNNQKVIAEGVETREELLKMVELKADYIQGYYLSKPLKNILEDDDFSAKF